MKYCPKCETRFDEDILRFCTKDGTPLVDEAEPKFIGLPSENLDEPEDDPGEITIIRRKPDAPAAPPPLDEDTSYTPPVEPPATERIRIPTTHEPVPQVQQVRPLPPQSYFPPPEPPNTAKTVILTIFGTLALLGVGALLFWALNRDSSPKNNNVNTNPINLNTNINSGSTFDSNFNFNSGVSIPTPTININGNSNTKTPTPTPKPSPSVTPSVSPTRTPDDSDSPTPTPSITPRVTPSDRPTISPTPRIGPRPPTPLPTRSPSNRE